MIAKKPKTCTWSCWMLILLALGSMVGAQAKEAVNVFNAKVAVEDDSLETREAAFKDALGLVLVRVTGRRSVSGDAAVVNIIDSAASYVQGYRYLREDDQQLIRVDFDPLAVERSVSESGLAVWSRERPRVLVWLAVDNRNGERFVLSGDRANSLTRRIETVAVDRGLPVILPLYDAQDRDLVSFADIWGGFSDGVESASVRYQADAILIGRARTRGRSWEVRWSLIDGNQRQQWVGGFADGVHQTADTFAQAFAVAQTAGEALVAVEGISTFQDYGRILKHLNSLSVVEQVAIQEATGQGLVFRLALRGDIAVLQRAMSLGGMLQPLSQDLPSVDVGPALLRYQYRP